MYMYMHIIKLLYIFTALKYNYGVFLCKPQFFTWMDAINYMYMDVMYSLCSDDSGLILYNFSVFQVHNFQAEIRSEGPGSGTSESSP